MVRPNEIVNAIIRSIRDSGRMPERTNYIDHEPSFNTEAIRLPIIEVTPGLQSRISEHNTDKVSENTDDSGVVVSEVYETLYSLEIDVSVWTVEESQHDERELGQIVRDTLYEHDTKMMGEDLYFDDGTPMSEIWRFRVDDAENNNQLNTSPPIRKLDKSLTVWASEQYIVTPDSTIEDSTLNVDQDKIDSFDDTITN